MLKVTRWCIAHRRRVFIAWVAIAILTTFLASAAGRNYATNFSLPGTESQRALDLLKQEFPAQSGDVDTIVFHTTNGTVADPAVKAAMTKLLAQVRDVQHVVLVRSPYDAGGAVQVSRDGKTAFATINWSKPANLLPNGAGKPVLALIDAVHVPGLKIAAGGQVIENAEGFSVGPATLIGAIAALVILLFTFGSLIAAGMPLITAGLGLITGVALIGLATHVTSIPNVSTDLALMIGLGVGVDYALFIVTRFRENYLLFGDVERSVIEAMDTSGRAILLAGTTVVIALLGMFATGVSFMYGLSIASILAVLLTLAASLTVLPAMLSRWGHRIVRTRSGRRGIFRRRAAASVGNAGADAVTVQSHSRWRQWSRTVQSRPWPLALLSLGVMLALLIPVFALRLESSDAGNDPANTSTRDAFDMLAQGFGPGFNGPLLLVAELPGHNQTAGLPALQAAVRQTPNVVAVTPPRTSPAGNVAVFEAYPGSAPQDAATTDLVNHLRHNVVPPIAHGSGMTVLVGGFTAGSIDFSHVLANKLPLFIGIVVVLSALLLFVIFRSIVIPIQAALMNLLSIGGAIGVTVLVFQEGWLAGIIGVEKGPVEPWIPVLMFAVVFGLSMDYEVFLVSRVREQWVRRRDASEAVADGIAFTGRVITAAAAIMICVFLSFMFGNERVLKEFGFGLAAAVLLDAIVVRCVLLPAVLELLGPTTWKLPRWLDQRLPHINIEGSSARALQLEEPGTGEEVEREPAQV
ncbi:MAG: MMPL family transporter [Solirubrobacterales bacterium]|nr:MMPL family transporter [Solirubrobacterales bacterium]MBV9364619.1 MMPL family transporter [Solirubrobacterales bacterium]MBV9810356.1 MMPL family transporter [Solirubrobacterales bacterium]